MTAGSRAALAVDREAERAAEREALRHRRSLAGRLERVTRWLRDPRSGPAVRLRRIGRVIVDVGRSPRAMPALPAALLAAARMPPIGAGLPPPRPPRSLEPERAAARGRLAAFDQLAAVTPPRRLRIALIGDAPLAAWFGESCTVIAVRPEDWRDTLGPSPPDLVVVGSALYGDDGAWQYHVAWYAHPDALLLRDLRALLTWSAEAGIASIFWDTQGAAGVRRFRASAALCDLIVAADPAAVAAYAALTDRRGAGVVDAGPPFSGSVADRLHTGLDPEQAAAA